MNKRKRKKNSWNPSCNDHLGRSSKKKKTNLEWLKRIKGGRRGKRLVFVLTRSAVFGVKTLETRVIRLSQPLVGRRRWEEHKHAREGRGGGRERGCKAYPCRSLWRRVAITDGFIHCTPLTSSLGRSFTPAQPLLPSSPSLAFPPLGDVIPNPPSFDIYVCIYHGKRWKEGGEGVDSGVGRGDARYRFKKFNRRWGIEEAKE